MPHLRGDLTTWSMWRQHADSSSTKLRITCKKEGPSSSRWKLWKINKDNQWSPISSFRCLLFSIFIFCLHFYFFCVLNWFISFLCRNVWLLSPLKLIAKFTLGGHRLVFCKLEKFSVPISLFCFILFFFILFFICLLMFYDIGDNV